MHHWRAWAPIVARVAATGLALLGLAGIGLAARVPTESGALARVPLTVGWAQLAGASAGVAAAASAAAAPVATSPPRPGPPVPCAPTAAAAPQKSAAAAAPASPAITADGRVILNAAGVAELQRLPGIGAKRAAAIVELRHRLGRFRRASELLRIKGIGPKTLERMLPKLVLEDG